MAKAESDEMRIHIERGSSKDDPNLLVGINGVNYLLPKGKTSVVPKAVYDEIMRSREAQEIMDTHMNDMREAAKQPT